MHVTTDPATLATLRTFAGTVRITGIEAIPFALPYRRPPEFASGSVNSADNVLVRVHTDAGLVGQAEAQPRPTRTARPSCRSSMRSAARSTLR